MSHWKSASFTTLSAILAIAWTIGAADAQMPKTMGASSLLRGGIPSVGSIGPGNAAGLLGYCVKHNYLSQGSASSVVDGLMKKPGVAGSPALAKGEAGQILNGNQPPVSLAKVPEQMKSKACNLVLKKGATLL